MTVAELIARLQTMDSDLPVILSADREGNDFGNLDFVELSKLNDCGNPVHPDDAEPDAKKAVVLWPAG